MAYSPCTSCGNKAKIQVSSAPMMTTPWQSMSSQQRKIALYQAANYWPPDDLVTMSQREYYQTKAVQKNLPYLVNDGINTNPAPIKDFYY